MKQRHSTQPLELVKLPQLLPSRSLRWRLPAFLGAMFLVTLLVLGVSVYWFVSQNEQLTWQGRQQEAARYAAETVAVFIHRVQEQLIAASILDLDDVQHKPKLFDKIFPDEFGILEFVYLDATGQVRLSKFKDEAVLAKLFTIPQSRWFVESQAGQYYLGNVQLSAQGQPYMIIAVPTSNKGVLAARLRMQVLWDVVANLRFGQAGQAYVVDYKGVIIAHSNPEVTLKRPGLAERAEIKALLQAPNHNWSGLYTNFQGIPVVGVTAPIAGTEWLVITELPQAEAFAVSRTALLLLVGGMSLFALLVVVITGYFLQRLIFTPLETLRSGAIRVGQGTLSHQIEVTRQDEVGLVTVAFNEMAHRLQDNQTNLIIARDQALAANHLKTELLAKVSHELRTPLGAIMGFAEMLEGGVYGSNSAEQQQALSEIIESSQYLASLVNELLNQAQLESGRLKLETSTFTPTALIEPIFSKMKILAQTKGLTLQSDIADDFPATLRGDLTRLQQILVNLISNAIKFTERGMVKVRLYRPYLHQYAIQITDTGIGIPTEAQAYIFEPFRQVDGSLTRTQAGTGLGLSIVKQLTELMGGQIYVDSQPGFGSTFTVLLPLTPTTEISLPESHR